MTNPYPNIQNSSGGSVDMISRVLVYGKLSSFVYQFMGRQRGTSVDYVKQSLDDQISRSSWVIRLEDGII